MLLFHSDMSIHFATVAKLENQMAGKMLDEVDMNLQWEILMFMLHLADISNAGKQPISFILELSKPFTIHTIFFVDFSEMLSNV